MQAKGTERCFSAPFQMEAALHRLIPGKAPGADKIHNVLLHCPKQGLVFLLSVFNRIWLSSSLPHDCNWPQSVPSTQELAAKAKSYRPVALLPAISKLIERMVVNRLIWWMDINEKLTIQQAGFRRFHDTFTHVLRLSEDVKQGMQANKHTLATFIDLKSAYDSVWRTGLGAKLYSMDIKGHMFCWLSSFLKGRRCHVCWNRAALACPNQVPAGVPQGSVIAPLLLLIYTSMIHWHTCPK